MNVNPALPGKVRQHRNGTMDRLKVFYLKKKRGIIQLLPFLTKILPISEAGRRTD